MYSYWDAVAPNDRPDYVSTEQGLHANIGETSAVLAIDDELVDVDELDPEAPDLPTDVPGGDTLAGLLPTGKGSLYRISDSGTWGDPSESTAERGEAYLDPICDGAVSLIEALQTHREEVYEGAKPTRDGFFQAQ